MSVNVQNGNVILIVLGVLLFVVSVIGGGFVIKDITFPKLPTIPRIGLGVFGSVLLIIGIVLSTPSSPLQPTSPTPTVNITATVVSTSVPSPTPTSPSPVWKVIINSSQRSNTFPGCTPNTGDNYLLLDLSIENLSSQSQVLSDNKIDLSDNTGGHYSESTCNNPNKDWRVDPKRSIHLFATYVVPISQSCFTLSIIDPNSSSIDDTWRIGCS